MQTWQKLDPLNDPHKGITDKGPDHPISIGTNTETHIGLLWLDDDKRFVDMIDATIDECNDDDPTIVIIMVTTMGGTDPQDSRCG
ncbi:MAG: hypothetical protein R3A11_01715 [Bdellovibrionota bacterium]